MRQTVAEIYDAHADQLYRYALMLLANHAAAEDALHQVFIKLAQRDSDSPKIAAEGPYLKTAIRNECYRMLQQHKRRKQHTHPDAARALLEQVEPANECPDKREELENALAKLPPEQREVVHLKIFEELTFREIAELLDIEQNTIASRYRYALDKLRHHLAGRL